MGESKEDKLLFMCVSMLWFIIRSQGCFLFCLVLRYELERCLSHSVPCIIKQVLFYEPISFLWFPCNLVRALLLIDISCQFFSSWSSSSILGKKEKWRMNDKVILLIFAHTTCHVLHTCWIQKSIYIFSMLIALCLSIDLRIVNRLWRLA